MTRLKAEQVGNTEIHEVLTTEGLSHSSKVVWMYLKVAADPQEMKPMARALSMDPETVSRAVKLLATKGLARQVSRVWLAGEAS
ncbi:hypothetical protein ACFV3E_05975 [Streptomyces sp. NPDC059718]